MHGCREYGMREGGGLERGPREREREGELCGCEESCVNDGWMKGG